MTEKLSHRLLEGLVGAAVLVAVSLAVFYLAIYGEAHFQVLSRP